MTRSLSTNYSCARCTVSRKSISFKRYVYIAKWSRLISYQLKCWNVSCISIINSNKRYDKMSITCQDEIYIQFRKLMQTQQILKKGKHASKQKPMTSPLVAGDTVLSLKYYLHIRHRLLTEYWWILQNEWRYLVAVFLGGGFSWG